MHSIQLQTKSPAACSAYRISFISCTIPSSKVGVVRVYETNVPPPLGQNTASASYGLDCVDQKLWFYINKATDWCYTACDFCQRILRNSIFFLLRHTFAIGIPPWKKTYKVTSRDHFQPPLVCVCVCVCVCARVCALVIPSTASAHESEGLHDLPRCCPITFFKKKQILFLPCWRWKLLLYNYFSHSLSQSNA